MDTKRQTVEELRSRGVVKLKDKDMFALWVKTACCNLTSRQLRKLASITDKYARGYLLFTTRQIPIIPFVNISDVEKVLQELSTVYLELDRCGPTVRNVNVCYDARVCPEAVTNSLSLGEKLDNFFRVPMSFKIKLGVSGCPKDCSISRILNDVSFVGTRKNGREGYDAYIGGRLGLNPFIGVKIAEGLSEDECVRLVQNYFDFIKREGKGSERAADIINRLGVERVKLELNKNLQTGTVLKPVECETRLAEKETDKLILRIRATCGEVTSEQLRKIADVAEKYGLGFGHFVVRGSPEIPGVNRKYLAEISRELQEVGLKILDSGIENLQSCFGNYCTESNADPQTLLKRIEQLVKDLEINNQDIKISASGCPNSCGIAHLNDIGFYGVVEPEIDSSLCSGCELCVPICKRKAIEIKEGVAVIDKTRCKSCGQCITVCPVNAIVEKRRGFAALVGGRDGENPRLGEIVAEYLSEDEALRLTEVCLKLLKEKKTDMASLLDELGIDQFKEMLFSETKIKR